MKKAKIKKTNRNLINSNSNNISINKTNDIISILPLILMVFLLPLIIRLKVLPIEGVFYKFGTGARIETDFFTYYKQIFIYLISIWALINTFFFCKKIKYTKAYYFMGAYALSVILSTIFSKYPQIALYGFTERKEGMWIILCYIILLFSAINLINNINQIKKIIYAIGISGFIISIIAIFQYIGFDVFTSSWGQSIIIPKKILETSKDFTLNFGAKYAYSVFYNPNYLGSYMSFYVPLMLAYGLIQTINTEKISFILLSIVGLIATFFSRSEAGILSLAITTGVILIIFFTRRLFSGIKEEEYKNVLFTKVAPSILIPVIIIVSLSYLPFENNPLGTVRKQAIMLFTPSDYTPLTKKTGPINDISQINDKTILIEVDKIPLKISLENRDIIYIKNEDDIEILKVKLYEPSTYSLPSEEYGNVQFTIIPSKDNKGAGMSIYYAEENKHIKLYLVTDGNILRLSDAKFNIINGLKPSPAIGFKGKANLASNRGYIWSRSIPIMLKYPIIGAGQDNFISLFPNQDIFGRQEEGQYFFWNMWIITDKPHNTYLQIGIQSGMISLLIILSGLFIILFNSMKNIILKKCKLENNIISFAVLGFMISSIFNDSIIAITPIIYILLAINIIGLTNFKNTKVEK